MRSRKLRPGHRRPAAIAAAAVGALCASASALAVATAPPGTTQLVTRPSGSAPIGPSAAADSLLSGARTVSADGRYVAFLSRADGLLPGADDDLAFGAYVKDRQTGEVLLASRADGPGGAPVEVFAAGISLSAAGGTIRVAFATAAALDPADANGQPDVYVRNLTTGTTVLASRASGAAGTPGNGTSFFPALSGDGTHVSFATTSSNLAGDADGVPDVHLRDLVAGTTVLVSRQGFIAGGAKGNGPSVLSLPDADGSHVAFTSSSTNLDAADTNTRTDVYLRDVSGAFAVTSLVSRADGVGQPVGNQAVDGLPSISDDGRYVAFVTDATNLNPVQPTGHVYRRDTVGNTTVLVDRADGAAGAAANADSTAVSLSADGTRAAFDTDATNLVPGDLNDVDDVYVRDLVGGTTVLGSRAAGVAGALGSRPAIMPVLSGDGATVLFVSASPELVPAAPTDVANVFARTLATGATTLVSRPAGDGAYTTAGIGSVDHHPFGGLFGSPVASISGDGRVVAFLSSADGLSDADDDRVVNVYARDLLTGQTVLVSRATGPDGAAADADSDEPVVSADGTRVAFTSLATNLVPGVPAGRTQIYVRDLGAGTTTLVSRADGLDGVPGTSYSRGPSISGHGGLVAFETSGAFDALDGNASNDVYVRDVGAGTTTLVSRAGGAAGPVGDGSSSDASISRDGRRVAFTSRAANLDPADALDGTDVFVRDLVAGTTVLASRTTGGAAANGSVFEPAADADGSRVVFLSGTSLVPGATGQQAYVRDLAAGTTTLASRGDGAAGALVAGSALDPSISADGNVVAFAFGAPGLTADDPDDATDVFVRDLAAGTTTLATRATNGDKANAGTEELALSADGSCLLLVSGASNLDPSGYVGSVGDFQLGYVRTLSGECPGSAPETTIAAGPIGRTNDPTPTFSLAADEPATFRCRLDGADFAACDATFTPPALAPGAHVLDVRAVDAAGLTDATPASSAFAVNAAPDSGIRRPGKRLRQGAVRVLRGTASDDLGVVRVEVAVVRLVGKARALVAKGKAKPACLGLTAKGTLKRLRLVKGACRPIYVTAKGTTTWTRALPASLPPGSYLVLSRAVDGDGLAETSFSAQDGNRRTFAVLPAAPKG